MDVQFVKTELADAFPLEFAVDRGRNDPFSDGILSGNFDFDEASSFIRRYFKTEAIAGRAFIDIGANIGVYTLAVASLGIPTIAVEALADNFVLLSAAVERNRIRHIQMIHAAASDQVGIRYIQGHAAWGVISDTGTPTPALTLDNILATTNLPRPAFLKIDVEGHEAEVLAGAVKTLEQEPHLDIMIEVFPNNSDNLRFLEDRGYHCYMIKLGALIPSKAGDFQEAQVTDYFCTRKTIASKSFAGTPIIDRDTQVSRRLLEMEMRSPSHHHRLLIGDRLQYAPPAILEMASVQAMLGELAQDPQADVAASVSRWWKS